MPPASGFPQRVLVTGANGNLGRALFLAFAQRHKVPALRAAVRSERAATLVGRLPDLARPEVLIVDYADEGRMREAASDCDSIVHLVGIIKEGSTTTYEEAHERSCEVLVRAASSAGVRRIVYLSICGSTPDSDNDCLASKGRAEAILLAGPVPTTVMRVPMVLGRGDQAVEALARQTQGPTVSLVEGGRTLQQPIDARDVARAVAAAASDDSGESHTLELGGPECLAHRDLLTRASQLQGRDGPTVKSIPFWAANAFARVISKLRSDPPITPAMLGVLQHDDRIDPKPACEQLGIQLTPLDETLVHCLGGPKKGPR